jgi:hypothetical protein
MPHLPNNDTDVYIVIEDFGPRGRAILETDLAAADREIIVRNFISGQYDNSLRVVAFNTAKGWSRDVSEDVAGENPSRRHQTVHRSAPGSRATANSAIGAAGEL